MAEITSTGTPAKAPPKSSRIFIRNLPSTNYSEVALRKHFSKGSAQITDCRYFPDRRIAFIGFKTAEEADKAVKYFDRSFIKTARLSVEIAKSAKDDKLGRPWSAHAPGSSAYARKHQIDEDKAAESKSLKRKRGEPESTSKTEEKKFDENDPKYREYMQLMKAGREKKAAWENETLALEEDQPQTVTTEAADASEDEYEDLSSKVKAEKGKTSKLNSAQESKALASEKLSDSQKTDKVDPELLPDVPSPQHANVSDLDWLKSRTGQKPEKSIPSEESGSKQNAESGEGIDNDEDMQDAPAEDSSSTTNQRQSNNTEQDSALEKISRTGRLFVRNLTYSVTEDDLTELFSAFGELEEIHLPIDPKTHKPKAFAYILFIDPTSAVTAYTTLDQQIFQGRTLHIIPAETKRTQQLDDFSLSKLPLKKQREILKKRAAAKSDFEWNSLYMNINSVMASMADRLGVSKSEILDPTSSDAAVKQAIAETRVIQETKSYFENHGINLASFANKKRGDRVILVKNFAYGTSIEELRTLCNEFGESKRILMPPAGTIAIVEYKDDPSGRAAFSRLYGRKLKESVLKVEKGPIDLFISDAPIQPVSTIPVIGNVGKTTIADILATDNAEATQQAGETTSLFVKNLSFSTTAEKLKDTFSPLDGFIAARIKTKQDPKHPGQTLSMGYGFVEFASLSQAETAQKTLNSHFLDGHKLDIRLSHRGEDASVERKKADAKKNQTGTKIIIKNLAFEVSEKQIRNLFSTYGKLRSVRVPKKFNRTSRGFGFAQFVSNREAENAMNALRHTHLHGRPLVLEWAKEDANDAEEEIQRLQKKVGKQVDSVRFAKLSGAAGRKKFDIETAGEGAGGIDEGDEE